MVSVSQVKEHQETGGPNSYHMAYGKIYMAALGLWPSPYKGIKQSSYNWYFRVTFGYFCVFVVTLAIETCISLITSMEAFAAAVGVSLGYAICIIKVRIVKSEKFVDILHRIAKKEAKILSSNNENVIKIYMDNVKFSWTLELSLCSLFVIGHSAYCSEPIVKDFLKTQNSTVHQNLIIESWFPFDRNEHYWLAYCIQFFACIYGTGYMFYSQAFFLSLLRYIVGQFYILQYQFRNFSQTYKLYAEDIQIPMTDKNQELFLKKLIQEHQTLIQLVQDLNQCLKTLILMDFGISSFQQAMVVYQLMHVSGSEKFPVIVFLLATNIQLYIMYWSGSEIAYQSGQLAVSIQESDWDTLPVKILKMMQLVILRAQKRTLLQIGPVGTVQFSALIQVFPKKNLTDEKRQKVEILSTVNTALNSLPSENLCCTEKMRGSKFYHMAYGKIYMTALGLWPFPYKGIKQSSYNWYYRITFGYFCVFVVTLVIQSCISLTTSMEAFAAAVGVSLGYAICIIKVLIVKSGKFVDILHRVAKKEAEILSSNDEKVIKMYMDNVKYSWTLELSLCFLFVMGHGAYCSQPIIKDTLKSQNSTVHQNLIIESWFPFDRNEHYWLAYCIQFFACIYGTGYMLQAFFMSLLRFIVGQFHIIQYQFKNFPQTYKLFVEDNQIPMSDKNQEMFFKKLIQEHQMLLQIVQDLNQCLKILILMDFGISSFQQAMVVYQLMHVSGSEKFPVIVFLLATNIQLYIMYWSGNEIAYQSGQLAVSIQESDWDTLPVKILKMMQLVILRAQKPTLLQIGPVGTVQFSALIQIYKAFYSYICLFINKN